MGLAEEFLEDAHFLAEKGIEDQRQTLMRSISTAYYAAFHLFIEDFVEHWEFPDQRARLARMFDHRKMCTGFTPKDKANPTSTEDLLRGVIRSFAQLQKDRQRADYDSGWRLGETDVRNAVSLAEDVFWTWGLIKDHDIAQQHLLSMFGARSD